VHPWKNFHTRHTHEYFIIYMRWEILSHKVGPNGEFTMTAVDHHCQTDGSWSPKFNEGIECCTHRASGEQHVVDEHYQYPIEAAGNV
jgi:hypothetical protein